MQNNRETLKTFIKVAVSSGIAIATSGQSAIIGTLINSIAGKMMDSFIEKAEFNKFKNLLQETRPADLNNELKNLIVKSVELSIQNIEVLYQKKLSDKGEIQQLKSFTNDLVGEVRLLSLLQKESIYKSVEKSVAEDDVLSALDIKVEEFPIINLAYPFDKFFKENFTDTLQLCFGELLKMNVNKPAYITYQREVYQHLDSNIEKILAQNELIISKLSEKDRPKDVIEANKTWSSIRKKVIKTDLGQIDPEFDASFNLQLVALHEKADILIDITTFIKDEIGDVKVLTKDIHKTLNENWVSKNRVWIYTIIGSLSLALAGLIWFNSHASFQMNVNISKDKSIGIHPQYPPLSRDARIRFYLPAETKEKEVTFSNEIILADIPGTLKATKCKIELVDPYWTVSSDSINIQNGNVNINIRPNESLSVIKGRVLSRDGQTLIENARVSMDGAQALTDQEGAFLINLPMKMRRIQYVLRVEKTGYTSVETEYTAGAPTEIRIEKSN